MNVVAMQVFETVLLEIQSISPYKQVSSPQEDCIDY